MTHRPHIALIAAVAANGAIGSQGRLLYSISDDMRRFRRLTTGHTVIMGSHTFDSLPAGPLPNRTNIVITHRHDYHPQGVIIAHSLDQAIALAPPTDDTLYIIGGGSIYSQAIHIADSLHITHIDHTPDNADTWFPNIDPAQWTVDYDSPTAVDPATSLSYRFTDYTRK